MPIFTSGTCKTENVGQCLKMLQALLDHRKASPNGEQLWGPGCSFASDGDGVQRAAFHILFIKKQISFDDPLHTLLSPLIGLNLQTGDDNATAEFDKSLYLRPIF
jgi:hypothetical protein